MQNRVVGSLAFIAGLASFNEARADVTAEVYSDLKGVIVELVTADVATSVVPQIACRSGHVPVTVPTPPPAPAVAPPPPPSVITIGDLHYQLTALDHFPRTLQALYARQFGGLKSAMLSEVADLAGYRLFVALRDRAELQQGTRSADGRLVADEFRKALVGLPTLPKDVAGKLALTIAKPELDRLGALKTGGQAEPSDVSDSTYGALPNGCLSAVRARFDEGTFGAPRQTPLENVCAAPSKDHIACDLALGLRSMLVGDSDAAERHVTRAVSRVVAGAVASKLSLASTTNLEAKLGVMITSAVDGAPPPDLLRWLADELAPLTVKYTSVSARATELATEVARVANALHDIEQPIRQLLAEWRLVASGDGRLDVASFVNRLLVSSGALHVICTTAGGSRCTELQQLAKVLEPGGLMWPLIQAASRADIRTVAQAVIASIFSSILDRGTCGQTTGAACQQDVYQRFATSLALYVIDLQDGGSAVETTRAAFRSAAVEVIRSIKPRGYTRSWIYNIPYPDFALRFSWNGGYVDDEGSSFRSVASMPFIVFRPPLWYTERAYAAVHVSVLDPLAPLSELALRPNDVDFSDNARVAWNLVSPRVDVVVGMPSLSSHLTLGIGGSLRLAIPYETTEAGDPKRTFAYRPLWYTNPSWSRSIEVGFSIKYML